MCTTAWDGRPADTMRLDVATVRSNVVSPDRSAGRVMAVLKETPSLKMGIHWQLQLATNPAVRLLPDSSDTG